MKKLLSVMAILLLSACMNNSSEEKKSFAMYDEPNGPKTIEAQQKAQGITTTTNESGEKVQQVDPNQAALYGDQYLSRDTLYMIDKSFKYDSWNESRTFTEAEKEALAEKWKESKITTKYHYYHGNVIKVDTLKSARDLREMRLRFYYGENDGFNDGDINHVLSNVAQNIVKETCGRGAVDALIVYDRPSADIRKPTAFYRYQVMETGVAVREFGFRCMYPGTHIGGEITCADFK